MSNPGASATADQADNLQQQLESLQITNQLLMDQLSRRAETPDTELAVNRITAKQLPPFWVNRPELWFALAENHFRAAGITSEQTKYQHIVLNLEERYASEVEDIIVNPPAQTPYTTLKMELIKRVSLTEQQRVKQLLLGEELGDRKPSQFLRHLRSLAGASTAIGSDLIKTLWLQRLPPHVQAILQTQPSTVSIDDLAATADKILEVQPTFVPHVNAVAAPNPGTNLSTELEELRKLINALQNEVKTLRNQQQQRSRSRSRQRSPERTNSNQSRGEERICWYHQRYGADANKCQEPCNFKPSSNSSGSK